MNARPGCWARYLPSLGRSLVPYAALLVAGCLQGTGSNGSSAVSPGRATATVQELMQGSIDPAADALWDSVAYIATASGVEDRHPRSEEDWNAVRSSAVQLIEAAKRLGIPDRPVAADLAETRAANPGELSPREMQQRIEASRGAFAQYARGLQEAGLKALVAIDARDVQGLMDAGGTIDQACEACHLTYWYPPSSSDGA